MFFYTYNKRWSCTYGDDDIVMLAAARSKEGPFWLAKIIGMSRAATSGEVQVKYYAKENGYYVPSTIEILSAAAIMDHVAEKRWMKNTMCRN